MMNFIRAGASVLAAAFLLPCDLGAEEVESPPNIILIIADDMAWDDSSPYGHETLPTPNLQRLADEGMRFDNAFLTISSCSPSRASILTGRYPHQTDADELHWPVPADQVAFTEALREAGYWAGAAGKWHLGEAMKDRFDKVIEVDTSGFQLPSGEAGKAGKFVETLEGEAQSGAADWIPLMRARDRDKPFFLWLAALDPHRPYHKNIVDPGATEDIVKIAPYHPDTAETRSDYVDYYDEIIRLDKYVGRVLDELDRQEIADNTLVLFISDNGRPFPRDKTTVYDSGIKTPWLVRWPAKVAPGSVSRELVSSVDIARTALDLAGVGTVPTSFEGYSTVPLLLDPETPVREFVFAEKNWHDFEDHVRASRDRRYKYIRNGYPDLPQTPPADAVRSPTYESMLAGKEAGTLLPHQYDSVFRAPRPVEELYDTAKDPHELNNLADDERYAEVLQTLSTALDNWIERTGDYKPELRTADEFDRVSGVPTDARVRPRLPKSEMVEKGLVAP